MAQELDYEHLIHSNLSAIKPSSQRVRNILTLEERVAVIKAYDQRPMYKKVARMFNCSWEQVKNIIANRTTIMEFYEASLSQKRLDDAEMDMKQRKLRFLGECVYECIQRVQYHAKLPITEELIRHKALEFLDVLKIPGFTPTKKWLNIFKATYNITLSNKQIAIYTKPQSSLDIKDIMAYCTKGKTTKALLSKYSKDQEKDVEYEARRLRKMKFLQDALEEYVLRVKFHHKSMRLDSTSLCQIARDFNEILKVQDFEPSTQWIEAFIQHLHSGKDIMSGKKPPLSLDLKDILSYCSRMQNKTKDNTITLAPKETALQMRVLPKYPGKSMTESGLKFQQNSIIYLDEEGEGKEKDIKPDINEISVERHPVEMPPPLKIRRIESINQDPELQRKFQNNIGIRKVPLIVSTEIRKDAVKTAKPTVVYLKKITALNSPKENVECLTPLPDPNIRIKEETVEDNSNYILPNHSVITPSPTPLRIMTAGSLTPPTPPPSNTSRIQIQKVPLLNLTSIKSSPSGPLTIQLPRPSPSKSEDLDSVELPRHVSSFKDVLLLLKPLEEYAMLKENYRAIGLITQLEEVLKNPPEEESVADDEFIG